MRDHRGRDREREHPVDQERQPASSTPRSTSVALAADLTNGREAARSDRKTAERSVRAAVTKSPPFGGSETSCAAATMGPMATSKSAPQLVSLTERAAAKIRELLAEEPEGDASVLRVAIQGGGCSGFQYALGFDRGAQEGDHELELHGVRSSSTRSARRTSRARASTSSTASRSPASRSRTRTSSSACGCGHSFQVDDDDAPARPSAAAAPAAPLASSTASRRVPAMAVLRAIYTVWSPLLIAALVVQILLRPVTAPDLRAWRKHLTVKPRRPAVATRRAGDHGCERFTSALRAGCTGSTGS